MEKKLQSVRAPAMTALIEVLPGQCSEVRGLEQQLAIFWDENLQVLVKEKKSLQACSQHMSGNFITVPQRQSFQSPVWAYFCFLEGQDLLALFIFNSESFGLEPLCLIDTLLKCYSFIFQFPGLCGPWCKSFRVCPRAVLGTGMQVADLKFIPSNCWWEFPSCGITPLQKELADPGDTK